MTTAFAKESQLEIVALPAAENGGAGERLIGCKLNGVPCLIIPIGGEALNPIVQRQFDTATKQQCTDAPRRSTTRGGAAATATQRN